MIEAQDNMLAWAGRESGHYVAAHPWIVIPIALVFFTAWRARRARTEQ